MRPEDIGSSFVKGIEAEGGDPAEPSLKSGYEAFIAALSEPVVNPGAGRLEDVLLFEVFQNPEPDDGNPDGVSTMAVLDRRVFFGDPPRTEILTVEWTFTDVPSSIDADWQIMGRGPGLSAGEGMVDVDTFVAQLRAASIITALSELVPVRSKVRIRTEGT